MKYRFNKVIKIYLFVILYFSDSIGCLYNVRDIGFTDILTKPYRLYFYIENDTPDTMVSTFKQIYSTTFINYNIEFDIINITQDRKNPALEYYNFWNIQALPAIILQAPSGRSMIVPISESNISFKENLWSSLEHITLSPIGEEIMENIVRAYGVILVVEGKNEKENQKVQNIVLNVRKEISSIMDQLPKRIDKPPHIITISQETIPEEKVLLWSLELDDKIGKEPVVVFLFGRARRFGPIMKGGEISQSSLLNIISIIGLSCECGFDLTLSMGQPILLSWGEKQQTQVLQYLGVDVENPMVKLEMSNILSLNQSSQIRDNIRNFDDIVEGYSEEIIKSSQEANTSRVSPSQMRDLDAESSASIFYYSIYILSILVILILAGGGYIIFQARSRKQW